MSNYKRFGAYDIDVDNIDVVARIAATPEKDEQVIITTVRGTQVKLVGTSLTAFLDYWNPRFAHDTNEAKTPNADNAQMENVGKLSE